MLEQNRLLLSGAKIILDKDGILEKFIDAV